MTTTPLHVLLIAPGGAGEPDLVAALRSAGFDPYLRCVAQDTALPGALDAGACDLVLLAAVPPQDLDASTVLAALRARARDVPVIVVAARAQADAALAALAAGAHDYVGQDDLRRLGPAVRRELRAAADRRERDELRRDAMAIAPESDERYRAISELTSDCAYALRVLPDGELGIDWITSAFARITSFAPDEVSGRGGWQALIVPDDVPVALAHLETLLAGRPSVAEYRVVTRSGETRRLQDFGHPVWDDAQGRVVRILGAVRDVSAQRSLEAALLDSEERYRAVSELSTNIAYTARVDPDGRVSIDWAAARLSQIMGYALEEAQALDFWQAGIYPEDLPRAMQHLQAHLSGRPDLAEYRVVTRDGEVRWFQDYGHPIWDDAQHRVVRIFGAIRDVTEQRRVEEALRESERQLAEAQRLAQLGSWSRDLLTDREQWSDEFYRLCGLEPGAIEPTYATYLAAVHPDDRAEVQRIVEHSLITRAAYTYQCRIVRPDGTVRHALVRAHVVEEDGRAARLYGTAQDITDQVQSQVALMGSERRFRDLVERAADAVFVHDLQGAILDVNQQACESVGYAREELLRMNIADVEVGHGPEQLARLWTRLIDGNPLTLAGTHRRKDGSLFPTEVRVGLFESLGQQLVLALARDITEHLRTEEALRQANEVLEAMIQASPLAIAAYDRDWRVTLWNPAAERIFGWSAEEVLGRIPPSVPPDRADETREFSVQLLAGRRITDMETERLRRDGQHIPVSLSAAPLRDAHGEVGGAMAIMADISARKEAEAALRASEQKLRNIFNWSLDGITLTAEDGKIVEWNTGMERISGLAAADTLGQDLRDVQFSSLPAAEQTPARRAFLEHAIRQVNATGQLPWANQLRENTIVRKDGSLRTVQEIAFAIPTPAGFMLCSIVRDITEQQQAAVALGLTEEQLHRRAAELQGLYDTALKLNSQLEPNELLRLIVEQAAGLLDAKAGGVFLYHPELDALRMEVGVGHFWASPPLLLKTEEGLSGKAFARHQSLMTDDYTQWEGHAPEHAADTHLRAMLAVPLLGREAVLGVLTLSGKRSFDEHDRWLAELFATQATVALENARLHAQVELRARQLAALNAAGQVMTSTLDLHAVLDAVIAEVKTLLRAASASVLLCAEDGRLAFAAAAGRDATMLVGTNLPPGAGIAGWAVVERRSALVKDAQNDPRFYRDINAITGVVARSLLAVPLVAHGDVMGVLEVVHPETNAFTVQDLAILEAMAPSAAIAIENARLYQAEREQYRRLQQSQAQLVNSEKQAALGRLIASLAHELNNPLQAMQNCMELILEFPLDAAEQREYQLAVQRETNRLMTLCNRVLDFARPVSFARQLIDVGDSARYALSLAGKQLEHSHIAVVMDLPADLPHVLASRDRLAQVFLNLIINAIEAMPDGGELRIAGRVVDDQVALTFTDTGPGIAPDVLPLVFEPLYTTKDTGTGLGLPICHNIIEQHGGTITAGNAPGKGAVITVRLPAGG